MGKQWKRKMKGKEMNRFYRRINREGEKSDGREG